MTYSHHQSDIATFLRLENLEERSVSSHVSWVTAVKVPQTHVYNFKCGFDHKAHFVLRWRSVGMVLSLMCILRAKPLTFTLLRRTPLHIFILRQSSFFLGKIFYNGHHKWIQITFRLVFSDTLKQAKIRKTRCIWIKISLQACRSDDNKGQWIKDSKD